MRLSTLARLSVAVFAVAFLCGEGRGQSTITIYTNPITGTNPNTSDPYTTGQTVASNLTGVGVGRGPGIAGTDANNRYNANGWNTSGLNTTKYFSILFTPGDGYAVDVSGFSMTSQASGTGPNSFALRTSLDNFATNTAPGTLTANAINYTPTDLTNLTAANSGFRIYGWGASGGAGTYSVNDFSITGLVSNRWSGGTDGEFATASNWVSGQAPTANNGVQFEGSTNTAVNVGANSTVQGIRFASGAASFTVSGVGSLTLGAGGGIANYSTNQQTINTGVVLGADQTINTVGNLTLGGTVGQTGGNRNITKTGTGTLTLSEVNTYAGTTTVSGGTLALTGSGSINNSPTVSVGSSGTFDVSATAATFTLGSSIAQTLQGTGTVVGNVNVNNGSTIRGDSGTGTGSLKLRNGTTVLANGSRLAVNLGASGTASSLDLTVNGGVLDVEIGSRLVLSPVLGFSRSISSYNIATFADINTGLKADGSTAPQNFFSITYNGNSTYSGGQMGLDVSALAGLLQNGDVFILKQGLNNNLVLDFQPVPEPATVLAVGAAGLGAISWLRRKRKAKAEAATTPA